MARYKTFDVSQIKPGNISERVSKIDKSVMIDLGSTLPDIGPLERKLISDLARDVKIARENNAPVVLAYGAHLFRNGCSTLIIDLMKRGYIQQLLTNGAGVIHDFEMALFGQTTEDVETYLRNGKFGIWEETDRLINEAITLGANFDKGYGESIGELISTGGIIKEFPYKRFSLLGTAYELNIPFSVSVSIGNDINFTHPSCDGAAIGKTSYRDFLIFANTVSNLNKGVFISVGSAIMAPMVLEKALSMARNVSLSKGDKLDNFTIFANDIQPGNWDWSKGEPPKTNPAYYLRFCKSFSRMDAKFNYLELDNRKFLHNLYQQILG